MSAKLNIFRGSSYPFTYNHTDSSGNALPLTGCTVYFTVKSDVYDTDQSDSSALIKKTITSHTNPAGGVTSWTLTDADTYITPGKYHFDIVVEGPDMKTLPPSVYGDFVVKGHPTSRNVVNG